jgi:hypothetical protein
MVMSTILLVLPILWATFGPVITTAVTAFVNQVVGAYVPRPIQLIISSLISAVLAGFTVSGVGGDIHTAESIAAVAGVLGLGTQAYASIHPATLLTTAPIGAKK